MLQWFGKRPLQRVTAFPAQKVESFGPPDANPNLLFHGDNKEVLAWLLANGYRGKVNLIYIDPPFDSGADYVRKVTLRGKSAISKSKIEGEGYELGEQVQYEDIWANDNYLQFMYERLILLKELLANTGTIYLHCDWHKFHHLRQLLDEVFGADQFRAQIVREKCNPKNYTSAGFGNIHDYILMYAKTDTPNWNRLFDLRSDTDVIDDFPKVDNQGRRYKTAPLHAPGIRAGETGKPWRNIMPPPGNHWRYVHSTLNKLDADRLIEWSDSGNPRKVIFADESLGLPIQDIWMGMKDGGSDYPTAKNEEIIERIVSASSNSGDLVLDCFIGSGTTAAVAQKLGRRWIGCDINKGAIQTTIKRLQTIIGEQSSSPRQPENLPGMDIDSAEEVPPPASTSFHVWRVNDYDLQIQHNEAVALACEHIGVDRTRTDAYFDGIQGKRVVKIIPFNHPLSPTDLEDLRKELKARKDEERDILLVCLGMEQSCAAWLEEWNRMRKKGDVPNKIEAIELRTDPKYGKFIAHRPASARVDIKRIKDKLHIEINDFVSPSIIERLSSQAGLLKPHIDNWRSMVDSVMIDPTYDGTVFNIALADIPEKKTDLVNGKYDLPAPKAKTTVAVKITDMLGEEVLVTAIV